MVRVAGPDDAATVATLLHDFNVEFATPTPRVAVLAERLEHLLAGTCTIALLAHEQDGGPALGVGLVTLRPSVWWTGPVGLLDELYVRPNRRSQGIGERLLQAAMDEVAARGGHLLEIEVDEGDVDARRFYERHGFIDHEPGDDVRHLMYHRSW